MTKGVISMIEKSKIVSDPDILQIKANVSTMLEIRKKEVQVQQPAVAISSPATTEPVLAQKVGEKNG